MTRRPLSLYLHIPFCVQKCLYCDFLSAPASEEEKEEYVDALLREIAVWQPKICQDYRIQTIFIGGGTPTCLAPVQLQRIGERLLSLCQACCSEPIEFTIEANPGTITPEHIRVFRKIGTNRISLGLQSAQNAELAALGRVHAYEDFVKSYRLLRANGMDNINIDLMADIPGQSLDSYRATLQQVLSLEPEHISSYSLIVEEGTPFYRMQEEGTLTIPDEDTDRQMYELTERLLKEQGYQRYEISNYAKKGRECRHNLTYWQMGEYLGLGLGAASYLGGCRFTNTGRLEEYMAQKISFTDGIRTSLAEEFSPLGRREEMEEYVFLGLRMVQGISDGEYSRRFGVSFRDVYREVLPVLLREGLVAESSDSDRIYLTRRGIDVSNRVLAEFLLEDDASK